MKSPDELSEFARESLGLRQSIDGDLVVLGEVGSARSYFRFKWNRINSVIIVHYQTSRPENSYHADISNFLLELNIPVPDIIRHDPENCLIIMKDLGDISLWSRRNAPWRIRKALYQKTLRIIHRLHSFPRQSFPSGQVKLAEEFSPDLYRWEQNYFMDNFIRGFCQIEFKSSLQKQIQSELANLAQNLSSDTRNLVHRDLQSQNVMIYKGDPYLIDFQGMRFGSRFYDLGSLLCDPYVRFGGLERQDLLSFYYQLSESDHGWEGFQNWFWAASSQRLMQALGAYAYLGLTKKLERYLKHIPAGLQNLRVAAERAASLPGLLELCTACGKALADREINGVSGNFDVSSVKP